MKLTDQILAYLRDHPTATNDEIAGAMKTGNADVRTTISRFKRRGWIEVAQGEDGKRTIVVVRNPDNVYDFKKSMLQEMCDTYFDDFLKAELYTERVEIGKMICRILDKL